MEKIDTLKKGGLSRKEIVLMVILTPLIFCVIFGVTSCLIIFASGGVHSGIWFYGPIGLFFILCFNIAWVLIVRLLFKKYKKTKILFMTMGFAISTSALLVWFYDKIDISHMFG